MKLRAFLAMMAFVSTAMAQGVIDVHSHIITPEFLSTLRELARMKQYLSEEADLKSYKDMFLYDNAIKLFKNEK
jgi:hypothetical protein